ncbi:hypothetical protein [Streptomyces sp. AK02-01A]|uniref:hypothetical protein n=1 Tax=Streptomyces sp. AK02-01A TaxID=3028648 RepID=UPI0029AC9772|nr:hypothetical protein [Streptomyces sp. AK02-01A]MDX3850003.1 hypothetical protein [Streptomyces sp. AK02-01A]
MALNSYPGRSGETPGGETRTGGEPLPCGREPSTVREAWEAGRTAGDPHLSECPHCAAALAGLAALEDAVRHARDAADPDPAVLTALTARIMDVVRLELRPGRTLPLGAADEDTWIVEAAAARTFRAAAESLPGVRAGSCRIGAPDPAGRSDPSTAPVGPAVRGPVRVRLEVVAGLHWRLPELAEAVRARVAEAARDALGIEVSGIDVTVVDLLDEGEDEVAVEDEAGHGHGGGAYVNGSDR